MLSLPRTGKSGREECTVRFYPGTQIKRSGTLGFCGWAFPEIPAPAIEWVHSQAEGKGATNIWAPFLMPYQGIYRLYYCVSAFGRNTSYIGMAESDSPEGPWIQKGCVVKTGEGDAMNAIDPSVIEDPETGKWWMHYGSYFGGLYCVELNPETGMTMQPEDHGHLIARRANYRKDIWKRRKSCISRNLANIICLHPTIR